jgi:hypothetical protein
MSDQSCERMRELAPELALDILSGVERASVQAHLNECADCREYVGSLTQVSDRLLTLVPGVEPPLGFEDRVLARMGMTAPQPRPSRRRHWLAVTAAAAVAALVFGAGGWVIGTTATSPSTISALPGQHNDGTIRFASFWTTDKQKIGQVFTYQDQPSWLYMTVSADPNVGWVACQLIRRDGKTVQVGAFTLAAGKGSWSSDLTINPSQVSGARLVSSDGSILATASFDNGAQAYLGSH